MSFPLAALPSHPAVPGLQGHQLPEPPLLESWLAGGTTQISLSQARLLGRTEQIVGERQQKPLSREPPSSWAAGSAGSAETQRPQVGINLSLSLGQSLLQACWTSSEGTVQALWGAGAAAS